MSRVASVTGCAWQTWFQGVQPTIMAGVDLDGEAPSIAETAECPAEEHITGQSIPPGPFLLSGASLLADPTHSFQSKIPKGSICK